jgi:hypothetical protein
MWRKLPPHLDEDDLQSLHNEETRKSEVLDMVCTLRTLKALMKITLKKGYKWCM